MYILKKCKFFHLLFWIEFWRRNFFLITFSAFEKTKSLNHIFLLQLFLSKESPPCYLLITAIKTESPLIYLLGQQNDVKLSPKNLALPVCAFKFHDEPFWGFHRFVNVSQYAFDFGFAVFRFWKFLGCLLVALLVLYLHAYFTEAQSLYYVLNFARRSQGC